ncbi:MAG: hypothetical protein ACC628_23900 [Pirellulaceae bacterium]
MRRRVPQWRIRGRLQRHPVCRALHRQQLRLRHLRGLSSLHRVAFHDEEGGVSKRKASGSEASTIQEVFSDYEGADYNSWKRKVVETRADGSVRTNRYLAWIKDERGTITYHEYDVALGQVTRTIQDVDDTQLTVPTGWSTPEGGGYLYAIVLHPLVGEYLKRRGAADRDSRVPRDSHVRRWGEWHQPRRDDLRL